jgi:hypothetical protein
VAAAAQAAQVREVVVLSRLHVVHVGRWALTAELGAAASAARAAAAVAVTVEDQGPALLPVGG